MLYSALHARGAVFMSGALFLLLLWKVIHGPQNTQPKAQASKGPHIIDLDEADSALKERSESGLAKQSQIKSNFPQSHEPPGMALFEQELWNLPGFQSLLPPSTEGISIDEFNPLKWENFYSDSAAPRFSSKHTYSFPSLGIGTHSQGLSSLNNLEAFVKEMLISLAEFLDPCSVSACLRSPKGKYHLFLQFSGNIFFSERSTEMEGDSWQEIIKRIETGEYVILNEGKELAFPLTSRYGPLGFLHFRCEDSLDDKDNKKEILEKLWYTIRKYGESLLQACIYEQSTRDPESTLFNGMRFQEDLCREMACRLEKNVPSHLILIMLQGETNSETIAFCGRNLALLFPFPQRVYRIGQNLFSIIDTRSWEDLKISLSEFRVRVQENFSFDISFGSAIPALDLSTPQEWFEQAQKGLF